MGPETFLSKMDRKLVSKALSACLHCHLGEESRSNGYFWKTTLRSQTEKKKAWQVRLSWDSGRAPYKNYGPSFSVVWPSFFCHGFENKVWLAAILFSCLVCSPRKQLLTGEEKLQVMNEGCSHSGLVR